MKSKLSAAFSAVSQDLLVMNFRMLLASAALAVLLCLTALAPDEARATTITLNFTTLPSAQGWNYQTASGGPLEASVFSVSGNVLHQTAIGTSDYNPWYVFNQDFGSAPFTLTMRAKLKGVEAPGMQAITFGVATNGTQFNIHITDTGVASLAGFFTFDPFEDHYYTIVGDPLNPANFQVYVDNDLLGTLGSVSRLDLRLFLGDGATSANGNVDVTYFRFSNDVVGVPGPIAGAGLPGLVFACGGLLVWYRRRQSATQIAA